MRAAKIGICIFFAVPLVIFGLYGEVDKQPKSLVIAGARLIDGTGSPALDDAIIVITGDRFTAVGPRARVVLPKDAEIIDAKGKTVIPGLIDAHVHFTYPTSDLECLLDNDAIAAFRAGYFLHQYLIAGITTVEDLLSRNNVGIVAKKAYRERLCIGSRPIVVGLGITCTGGHATEDGRGRVIEADGPAEWRRAVRKNIDMGADIIKILPPYSREEIKEAVEEAHAWKKLVLVHHYFLENYDFTRWAVEAGADCLEHAQWIPDDLIQEIADKDIFCVPTLSVFQKLADVTKKSHPEEQEKIRRYQESTEIFKKLKAAGVKMGVGTDFVKDFMVEYPEVFFEEIERFVENGCTPMEAITAATKLNAAICDASDKIGTIEKGKLADLLVIEGDPLNDIRALRHAQIIIQDGRIIKQ